MLSLSGLSDPKLSGPAARSMGQSLFSTCSFFVNNSPAMARKKRRNRASSDSSESEKDSEVEVSEEASDNEPVRPKAKAKAGAKRRKVCEIGHGLHTRPTAA
jgi:hypothetical protein